MHATGTATCTTTAPMVSSYASTSYQHYDYIQRIPILKEYPTLSSSSHKHTINDPIILPPLPEHSNPVLTTPHASRARRARTTSPSHLSHPAQPATPSYHPYSKRSSPSHSSRSAQPASPPHKARLEHAEPDTAQALNDLHYLSSLTASQRAELYRRSRLASSPTSEPQGWLSCLPSLLHTLKSRLPSTSAHTTSSTSTLPSLPSLPTFESYTALTHLLASERLENAKLKRACEVLKRQVREVSARCCALEALGFAGSGMEGMGSKKGKGKRGVKRRREEDSEEGKRTNPSSRSSSTAGGLRASTRAGRKSTPWPARTTKRSSPPSPALPTSSTASAKRLAARKTPSTPGPGKSVIEPPSAQIPNENLPEHARRHHPGYQCLSGSIPQLESPICLSASCDTATSSTLTTSETTSSSTLTASVTSRTSTPSSLGLGLTLKPLRYDDGDESDSESLPTPSYLPIPFLSQQARSSAAIPEAKCLYDSLVDNKDTKMVHTAPATPEGKSTTLERPPTPPKRVNSANGRMQSGVRTRVTRAKSLVVVNRESTTTTSVGPDWAFEITPSPSPATAVNEDEEQEKEKARERPLLDLMFVNTGREIECRACRINTTYPRSHTKHIPISQIHTFIQGTTEKAYIAHLVQRHAAEWGELKRLSEREVGLLRRRLGIRSGCEGGEGKVGYMDLTTGEFVRDVEKDVRRDVGRADDVPEIRPRRVDITPSHLIMRMAATKQREGMGMVTV